MLTGGHVGARASDLLDGRLSWPEEQRVRAHLGRCPECAAQVQAERDLRSCLRGAADQSAMPSTLLGALLAMPSGLGAGGPALPHVARSNLGPETPLGVGPLFGDSNLLGNGPPLGQQPVLKDQPALNQPVADDQPGFHDQTVLNDQPVLDNPVLGDPVLTDRAQAALDRPGLARPGLARPGLTNPGLATSGPAGPGPVEQAAAARGGRPPSRLGSGSDRGVQPRGPRLRGTLIVTTVLVSAATVAAGASVSSAPTAARRVMQGGQVQSAAQLAQFTTARLSQSLSWP